MRQKPVRPGTERKAAGRKVSGRLRDGVIPMVPTVRADENKAATPADTSEQESEAEAAVRRMVEAAYT
jgi:hypothetical protein